MAARQHAARLPVMAMPAAVPVPVVPAPVTPVPAAMPMVVPVMTPAHLFGLQAAHFVRAGHRGTQFRCFARGRQLISGNRLRRQRRGLDACRQRGGAGGNSNGEFQKIAAFHDISLFVRGK